MTWTKTPPTEPGHYWGTTHDGEIECVELTPAGRVLIHGGGVSYSAEAIVLWWSEPIVPPKPPQT